MQGAVSTDSAPTPTDYVVRVGDIVEIQVASPLPSAVPAGQLHQGIEVGAGAEKAWEFGRVLQLEESFDDSIMNGRMQIQLEEDDRVLWKEKPSSGAPNPQVRLRPRGTGASGSGSLGSTFCGKNLVSVGS